MSYWTKDIVVDPNDATQNTWYVCVFSGWGGAPNGLGGLYKTIDRGITWNKLTGSTIDRATSCTFNPNNANQLFITTEGQGLWMSNNINAGTPSFTQVTSYPFRQPERVFFNPTNANEMWVTSFGNGLKVGQLNTGVLEFDQEKEIIVYPNPASNQIHIKINNPEYNEMKIYSAAGALILNRRIQNGENIIDIKALPEGMYVIKTGERVNKFIVNH
jgi:hypothetical protein